MVLRNPSLKHARHIGDMTATWFNSSQLVPWDEHSGRKFGGNGG